MMDHTQFKNLCAAGKFREALSLVTKGYEEDRLAPSRFSIDKKTKAPIFYRGNKRVELSASGEWQLSKNPNPY